MNSAALLRRFNLPVLPLESITPACTVAAHVLPVLSVKEGFTVADADVHSLRAMEA